ncbi:MAG: hypothetical protein JOY91_00685 [Sinobacteraceae bacterium]|nr:hypothetical protein [Nevskiaceae bacterium]
MSSSIGFISGLLTGVAVTLLVSMLYRRRSIRLPRPGARYGLYASGLLGLFALSAALIYFAIGSPGRTSTALTPPHTGSPNASGKAQSLESATAGLEARLNRDGGTEQEWLLLAQSYDFMGRSADADRARTRAAALKTSGQGSRAASGDASPAIDVASAPNGLAAAAASLDQRAAATTAANAAPLNSARQLTLPEAESRTRAHPDDAQNWLALASLQRTQHAYDQARAAYVKAIALHGMTAQSWADYADTLGSLSKGHIGADAGEAIRHALALDPNNAKALWLEASRQLQDHHYRQSLADWQRLRAALPADSPDVQLVDANIAEASQLAGVPAPAPQPAPAPHPAAASADSEPSDGAQLSGTVSIDSRLAGRVGKNSTLFIYAKAPDSPGPPLAVMRTAPQGWPVAFHLDDSMAMVPGRRLSQSKDVIVEARISQLGQAQPSPGDLYVTSEVVHPANARQLALVINREIH